MGQQTPPALGAAHLCVRPGLCWAVLTASGCQSLLQGSLAAGTSLALRQEQPGSQGMNAPGAALC